MYRILVLWISLLLQVKGHPTNFKTLSFGFCPMKNVLSFLFVFFFGLYYKICYLVCEKSIFFKELWFYNWLISLIFNWMTIALKYCVCFCHASTWFSHRYILIYACINWLFLRSFLYYSRICWRLESKVYTQVGKKKKFIGLRKSRNWAGYLLSLESIKYFEASLISSIWPIINVFM